MPLGAFRLNSIAKYIAAGGGNPPPPTETFTYYQVDTGYAAFVQNYNMSAPMTANSSSYLLGNVATFVHPVNTPATQYLYSWTFDEVATTFQVNATETLSNVAGLTTQGGFIAPEVYYTAPGGIPEDTTTYGIVNCPLSDINNGYPVFGFKVDPNGTLTVGNRSNLTYFNIGTVDNPQSQRYIGDVWNGKSTYIFGGRATNFRVLTLDRTTLAVTEELILTGSGGASNNVIIEKLSSPYAAGSAVLMDGNGGQFDAVQFNTDGTYYSTDNVSGGIARPDIQWVSSNGTTDYVLVFGNVNTGTIVQYVVGLATFEWTSATAGPTIKTVSTGHYSYQIVSDNTVGGGQQNYRICKGFNNNEAYLWWNDPNNIGTLKMRKATLSGTSISLGSIQTIVSGADISRFNVESMQVNGRKYFIGSYDTAADGSLYNFVVRAPDSL